MPATQIFTQAMDGPYVSLPVTGGDLDITWTAADTVNGNYFQYDAAAGDIILVWNTDTATHTWTLTSNPDSPFLRTGDIANYSVAAGVISVYNLNESLGWINTFNDVMLSASSNLVKFAILTLQT
jgi:hypothetical protein